MTTKRFVVDFSPSNSLERTDQQFAVLAFFAPQATAAGSAANVEPIFQ